MKKRNIIIIVVVLAFVSAGFLILKPKKVDAGNIEIQTAKAEAGTISKTVTATGTLEAILTVEVGTQVSGIIENIYVDFNSYVKKGQLLARLDTTNLAASLDQSRATLDNAKAELDYQTANHKRLTPLYNKQLISQAEYDQVIYSLKLAQASYNSALAQYKKNKINLDYAMIYSPIDGIILNRAVEEGQTVAASFSTPTLFSIANDLTRMQVEASIDEADIGQVKQGQRVEFTVDAYADDIFEGEVTEVRLEPTVTNNVVTYTIIIAAPNPDYKLMPGMTAETEIYVVEKKDLLVVPSKALRFNPDEKLLASYMGKQDKPEAPKEKDGMEAPEGPGGFQGAPGQGAPQDENVSIIWVKHDSVIHPQMVETGLDNDINVEILSGLQPGDEVILSMEQIVSKKEDATAARNPFMPGPPPRK